MKRIKIDRGRATRADKWVRVRVVAVRRNRRTVRRKAEHKWAWVYEG